MGSRVMKKGHPLYHPSPSVKSFLQVTYPHRFSFLESGEHIVTSRLRQSSTANPVSPSLFPSLVRDSPILCLTRLLLFRIRRELDAHQDCRLFQRSS
jgi:hypothetical protein